MERILGQLDCHLRKAVHLVKREADKVFCESDGDGDGEEEEDDHEERDERRNYIVRALMVIPK